MALILFMIVPMMMTLNTVKATTSTTPVGDISVVPYGATLADDPPTYSVGGVTNSWTQADNHGVKLYASGKATTLTTSQIAVDIRLDNSVNNGGYSNVWGYSFDLNWTAPTLQLVKVFDGPYLVNNPSNPSDGLVAPSNLIDNTKGYIQGGIANAIFDTPNGAANMPNQDDVLVTLLFTVTAPGSPIITLSNVALQAGGSDNTLYAPTSVNNAQITLNLPSWTLAVVSAHGNPYPAVGTDSLTKGITVAASVNSPVTEANGNIYACTGYTGAGSVPASGTGNAVNFTITANSQLNWTWVQVTEVNPLAIIKTTGGPYNGAASFSTALTLDGTGSKNGIDTTVSPTTRPITAYSWVVTLVGGTQVTSTSSSLVLTAAQVGSTTGLINATLTVTAPDGTPAYPSYNPVSTTTVMVQVINGGAAGTVIPVIDNSQTIRVGDTFQVNLTISNAANIWGWSTNVNWNPSQMKLLTATDGGFLSQQDSVFFIGNSTSAIDNVVGTIDGGLACSFQSSPETATSSSGVLAVLTFQCLAPGPSDVTLSGGKLLSSSGDNVGLPQSTASVTVTQFVLPEYALGALIALGSAFAAFAVFAFAKKSIHIPSFNKHI